MGLDIAAYSNIDVVRFAPEYVEAFEDVTGIDYGYINTNFPHAITVELNEPAKFIYFMERGKTERISFRAGSYSGYSDFRSSLCDGFEDREMWAHPELHNHLPFFELICFSDCEGVFFGNDVCGKLHNDFVTNYKVYVGSTEEDWMIRVYEDFLKAFELASQDGIVIFR